MARAGSPHPIALVRRQAHASGRSMYLTKSCLEVARDVLPRFADCAEAKEAEKRARLAASCERALERRMPARRPETEYVVTAQAEPFESPSARNDLFARMVRARNDAQLERLMSFPAAQWMVFKGLERALAGRINGFQGAVEYRLTGSRGESRWHLRIQGSRAEARPGQAEAPVLVFRTTLPIFARMAAGEINPAHAILERKLEVQGDVKVLARFSALFGPKQG